MAVFSLILKYVHELFIFAGFVTSIGSGLVLQSITKSGDAAVVASAFRLAIPIRKTIPIFYGVGSLLGIATAVAEGFNLLAPWLVLTYILVISLAILGERGLKGWHIRVLAAAEKAESGPASGELAELLAHRGNAKLFLIDLVALGFIVFLMVFKPFSG